MKRLGPWLIILVIVVGAIWGSIVLFTDSDTTDENGTKTADTDTGDSSDTFGTNDPYGDDSGSSTIPDPDESEYGNDPLDYSDTYGSDTDDTGTDTGGYGTDTGFGQETAADIYEQAISDADEKGIAAAVPTFEKVIDTEPGGEAAAKAARKLAKYYVDIDDKEKAVEYYNKALDSDHWLSFEKRSMTDAIADLGGDTADPAVDTDDTGWDTVAGVNWGQPKKPKTKTYTVKAGDTLSKIAKKYKTTVEHIRELNNLKGDLIRIDDELKVASGPFEAIIDKSDLTLRIMHNGEKYKEFPVGLGKNDSTPVGTFYVETKLVNPDWYSPEGVVPSGDPDNILGTRWIGFKKKYGIHGTTEPDSIGKYSSNGCVRMRNSEVERVYALLVRKHSKVTIRE